jgi:hypothetical protein
MAKKADEGEENEAEMSYKARKNRKKNSEGSKEYVY